MDPAKFMEIINFQEAEEEMGYQVTKHDIQGAWISNAAYLARSYKSLNHSLLAQELMKQLDFQQLLGRKPAMQIQCKFEAIKVKPGENDYQSPTRQWRLRKSSHQQICTEAANKKG